MQAALVGFFWYVAAKLGQKFFAELLVIGVEAWSASTPNPYDDKVAAAIKKAME